MNQTLVDRRLLHHAWSVRRSQRKTLAARVWAVMLKPLLGILSIGHSLAMAKTTAGQIRRCTCG